MGKGTGTGKGKDGAVDGEVDRGNGRKATGSGGVSKARKTRLLKIQEELTASMEVAEARVAEIDGIFCEPTYYERTPPDEVKALEAERTSLQSEVAHLMSEWECAEEEIA